MVTLNPLMVLLSLSDAIELPNPSAMRIKGNSDRGSPYLRTLEVFINPEGTPLTKIEKKSEETKFIT